MKLTQELTDKIQEAMLHTNLKGEINWKDGDEIEVQIAGTFAKDKFIVLKNVTNVLGFLGATKGGVPVPMRQSEINRILGKVDDMALADEQVNIPFVVGENVKVIDGPFNSFHAEIEAIDEQKKKLQLMVKIFGRKTPLELNFMQVEKI